VEERFQEIGVARFVGRAEANDAEIGLLRRLDNFAVFERDRRIHPLQVELRSSSQRQHRFT